MFCVVIWTLEKRCRWGNPGFHVCVARVDMVRGSCAWKSSSKAWELASVWGGEGWRNRNHSTKRNSRKFCFLVSTPGKTQQPAAEGPFTKHKRHGSTRGAPCLSNALQVCYGFYSYNYSGSKTTSRDCKSAARINVFPLLRKKRNKKQNKKKPRQCSYLTCALDSFEWIKRKGLMWFQWSVSFHAEVCESWLWFPCSLSWQGRNLKKNQ